MRCGGIGTLRFVILVASVPGILLGEERMGSEEGEKCGLPSESICIEVSSSVCIDSGCI